MMVLLAVSIATILLSPLTVSAEPENHDARINEVMTDSWAFSHKENQFGPEALLDLRHMNEKIAGEKGWVGKTPDGNGFTLGDGTPVKFWGSTWYARRWEDQPEVFDFEAYRRHARWLAKLGVNMSLHFMNCASKEPGAKPEEVDEAEFTKTWRIAAACRENGIYTVLNPFSTIGTFNGVDLSQWGIAGYSGKGELNTKGSKPFGVLFFNGIITDAFKRYTRKLLTEPNPHTGIAVKDDPSVMGLLLQGEDGLFFFTVNQIAEPQMKELERIYNAWLKDRYGDGVPWKAATIKGDEPERGHYALDSIHALRNETLPADGDKARRHADQTRFYAEVMRNWNEAMTRFVKDELGFKGLILPSNWRTANNATLVDAERWSYLPGDVMPRTEFVHPIHYPKIKTFSYMFSEGDFFMSRTMLQKQYWAPPHAGLCGLPFAFKHVKGYPSLLTAMSWFQPSRFRAEGPWIIAAYGALTGLDAMNWECSGMSVEYENSIGIKCRISIHGEQPVVPIGYPAAAILFRKGYVKEAAPVLEEKRSLDEVFARKRAAAVEPYYTAHGEGESNYIPFWKGPTYTEYAESESSVTGGEHPEPPDGIIRSATGELMVDILNGLSRMDAPKAQGAVGFLGKAGRIALSDITLESKNEFISVLVVPMDDKPLAQSEQVLLQTVTEAWLTGFAVEAATPPRNSDIRGARITATGEPPWRFASTKLKITIDNPGIARARLLDSTGCAARDVELQRDGDRVTVELPPDAIHVILESHPTGKTR